MPKITCDCTAPREGACGSFLRLVGETNVSTVHHENCDFVLSVGYPKRILVVIIITLTMIFWGHLGSGATSNHFNHTSDVCRRMWAANLHFALEVPRR